jgi:hypothetical protein
MWPSRASSVAFFVALLASALMLGPALAHLFELPNKIILPRDEYFIVQRIYRGWNSLAVLLAMQLISLLTAAFLARRQPRVLIPTLFAILFVAAAQALFWSYTYPANVATANWTVQPDNWDMLRQHWEYSHAAGAGLQILGFTCLVIAVVSRLPTRSRNYHYY